MIQPRISHLSCCRICGSTKLQRFLHLPQMPFTDDFIPPERLGREFRADIDVFVCQNCLTAQTQHDVDVGDYYEDYQYSVGGSPAASRFMRLLAEKLQAGYYPGEQGRKVLEVGSGDGEQLVAFKNTGCRVLGFEPSSSLCKEAETKGIDSVQGLFTAESASALPADFKEVDVVMLSYTFDHLPDPRAFLEVTRSILNQQDGLVVVEIHDLERIIERQEYCLFEHEHSIYLTEATVNQLCDLTGFEVINFDLVPESDRRANSLIFVATPADSKLAGKAVTPRTPPEFAEVAFYDQVGANVRTGIANLEAFVDRVTDAGKTLAGYGAGGRGVMTLAAMQNASKFRYLVDKKPKRPGLVVPKSGLSLVGLDALRTDPVNHILVFSYGYMPEIQQELSAFGYQSHQFSSLLDVLAGR